MAPIDITTTPEWDALAKHHAELGPRHLRELFAEDPGRGRAHGRSRRPTSTWTTPRTGSPTRPCGCSSRWPSGPGCGTGSTGCSPASTSTSARTGRCCTPRCGCRRDASLIVDGQDVVADVHEVLDRMGRFADRVRSGQWTGATGRADQDGRQHRHRRLRPRPGDGVRGAEGLQRRGTAPSGSCPTSTRPTSPRRPATSTRPRRCSSCRRRRSPRWRRSPTRRRPAVAAGRARRPGRRRRGGQALRRGVHQRAAGGRVRDRPGEHVRVLGLGRRPLLDGLGGRAVD